MHPAFTARTSRRKKRCDAKTGTMTATGNCEPFAGGENAAMPNEYRTSYRAGYEDEPARLKERLADAASDAAQADEPSILAEALKEEYAAAAERAGLRDKPGTENFLEAATAQQTAQAVNGASAAVYRISDSPDSAHEAEKHADYAARQIECLENFISALNNDPELRQETQAVFHRTHQGEGRIDIDFYSSFEVSEAVSCLEGPFHHPPDHERTPLEDYARDLRAGAVAHAQYMAAEYQALGNAQEKEAYQESIARSAAIAAAAGRVVRREIGTPG